MKKMKSLASHISVAILLSITAQSSHAALVDMAEYQDWEGVAASIASEDINAVQPDGVSALMWATYYDQTDIARMLLDAGANPNLANRYGMTPLIQAAFNGNDEIIAMLLAAGADPNARTLEGENAILNASKSGAAAGVLALIEAGADVNSRDGYLFQTPLMWAAASNQAEVARVLIEHGADMDARSAELDLRGVLVDDGHGDLPDGGLTALHHAARENSLEAAQVIVSMGANPSLTDPQEITPLRVAMINANLDMARVLIEGGANVNDGSIVELMDIELSKFLIGRSETNHVNQSSIEDIMQLMLTHGLDIDSTPATPFPYPGTRRIGGRGTIEQTALYNASIVPNIELMSMLLDNGANPNSLNRGGQYFPLSSALDVIPLRDVLDTVKPLEELTAAADLLFEHGADINAIASDGTTVLHHAAATGRDEVVEYLIAKGADLSVKDSSNRTALDVAKGVPKVWNGQGRRPAEPAVYDATAEILRAAMDAQGVAIEEYAAPAPAAAAGEA
jgi:ankyrin repeat protein